MGFLSCLEVILFTLLMFLSGFFSSSEMALFSLSKEKIHLEELQFEVIEVKDNRI